MNLDEMTRSTNPLLLKMDCLKVIRSVTCGFEDNMDKRNEGNLLS